MTESLHFTVDKFTFTIATDRLYHPKGVWVQEREGGLLVGVTDYVQQSSGDVAFAEVAPVGSALAAGDILATIETIKVNVELIAPVSGTIVSINEKLELEAEIINQDPYGQGWLALLEPAAWEVERATLMSPDAYYAHSHAQALEEIGGK